MGPSERCLGVSLREFHRSRHRVQDHRHSTISDVTEEVFRKTVMEAMEPLMPRLFEGG